LVRILDEEAASLKIRLELPVKLRPVIPVPTAFFDENYSKDLTARAHYVYLVILYKSALSGESPIWLGSGRNVERDFPITRVDFRLGVNDLRVQNLIEIFPFKLRQGLGYQGPEVIEFRYLLNRVIGLSEKLRTWEQMRNAYGDDPFIRARELAELIGEPEDPIVITTYLKLQSAYTMDNLRAFTRHLGTLPPQSTPSKLDYLTVLLKNEAQRNIHLATF